MDPVSLALGVAGVGLASLALFEPSVKACFQIWGFYELSQNYGTDYRRILRSYRLQVVRTSTMMTQDISIIVKVPKPNTPETSAILEALVGIKRNIEICEGLMERHGEPLGPRYNDPRTNLQKADKIINASANSLDIDDAHETHPAIVKPKKSRRWFFKKKAEKGISSNISTQLGSQSTINKATTSTSASSISRSQNLDISGSPIQKTEDQMIQDAQKVQHDSKHKTRWIAADKEKFEKAVKDIKSLNDFMQNNLMIKYVTGHSDKDHNLIHVNNWDSRKRDQDAKRSNLEYLHKSLQTINTQVKPVCLSIRLRNEPSEAVDGDYVKFSGKKMSFGAKKYIFHMSQTRQSSDMAFLMIAEFKELSEHHSQSFLTTELSLENLKNEMREISGNAQPPLQCLGRFDRNEVNQRVAIYQDVSQRYRKSGDLAQELRNEKWRSKSFQADHVQLARSIAEIFLTLGKTFTSSLPKASDFVNFSIAEAEGQSVAKQPESPESDSSSEDDRGAQLNQALSKLSTLSLTSNFGAEIVRDTSSLLGPAQDESLNLVAALGLILYQIGSWKLVKYKICARSMETAISNALGDLTSVDTHLPGHYTRAVEACLRWQEEDLNPFPPTHMLERLVASLRNYEADLRHRF